MVVKTLSKTLIYFALMKISKNIVFVSLISLLMYCTSKNEHAKLTFLLKGNESLEENDLEKANFYYNEAILTDSTYIDAYMNNALVFEAKGELYDAIEMYDQVLILNPTYDQALYKRANLYLDVDQYYRALDDLKGLNNSWKDSAKLYFTKGLVQTKLRRYNDAIQEFQHSLVVNGNQAQAYINIGNVYYYKNELDSASSYLRKGLELDASEANGFNTLGLISTKQKAYENALLKFNKALTLDDKNAWSLNNKAYVFIKTNELDSASYLINESMKLDPYNAWVYRNKGLLEIKKHNVDKALKYLEKAYKMDQSIDSIIADLAYALSLNNQLNEACFLVNKEADETKKAALVKVYCL